MKYKVLAEVRKVPSNVAIKKASYKKISQEFSSENRNWRTGKVFTQAPGFGPGKEVEESRIITIRPEENEYMALMREGFDPKKSRIEIINL